MNDTDDSSAYQPIKRATIGNRLDTANMDDYPIN